MQEIVICILEIILLIIKMKVTPEEATWAISKKYNVAFSKLWEAIPKHWR